MNERMRWILVGLILAPLTGFGQGSDNVRILEPEAAEHRIGERGPIYTSLRYGPFSATCEAVVGTDGAVINARMSDGFISDLTPLCRTWRYKPFERNGQRVTAEVRESIAILPMDELPEVHVPFPEIRDWKSLRITLSRSPCYGNCPAYAIEIHGDGTVAYEGQSNVGTTVRKKGKISQASLVKLVDAFRKADYFSLAAGYASGVTDMPTCVTSIGFDGVSKSVLNYVGGNAGMPAVVSELEAAIDRLSGDYKWIGRK